MDEFKTQVERLQEQVDFLMNILGVRVQPVHHLNHRTGETWTSIRFEEDPQSRLKTLEDEIKYLNDMRRGE